MMDMMKEQTSWLPAGGKNVFQRVKEKTAEVRATGKTLWPLTIGQPTGAALLSAREAASELILSADECVHEYQDNGSPGVPDFAKRFVLSHFSAEVAEKMLAFSFLPIPGIKPMLGLIPMACGGIRRKLQDWLYNPNLRVATMTNPGYGTPEIWCDYLGVRNYALNTTIENQFLFSLSDIRPGTTLLMLNFPHNPTGQIATKEFWRDVCAFCLNNGIRLFNDAAYAALTFSEEACMLAEVAPEFPGLSWGEAYSASKAIGNGTGWRIGALVGSKDFIEDIATIKGNTDSGFVAAAAGGVIAAMEDDMPSVVENCAVYARRTDHLISLLTARGMKLAVRPKATFFSTWQTPRVAFGQEIANAEKFNELLMANTGVYGIPFSNLLRLTVTKPVDGVDWTNAIRQAFELADVRY